MNAYLFCSSNINNFKTPQNFFWKPQNYLDGFFQGILWYKSWSLSNSVRLRF